MRDDRAPGYDKHGPAWRGSGHPAEIDVPHDTNSSFDPQILKGRQRRLTGTD